MHFRLPSFEFYQRMSARERFLTLIVGGSLLFIVNLVAISVLLRSSRELRTQIADKSQELSVQQMYAREQPMWKQRTDWLKAKQPIMVNPDRAGSDLLNEVQAEAKNNRVMLTTFQITPRPPVIVGDRAPKPQYQTASVSIETQSDWAAMVQFLAALQRPEGFLVLERATLRSDPNDPQRIKGGFGVSKWYAPGAK